jgi:hypothetical protein
MDSRRCLNAILVIDLWRIIDKQFDEEMDPKIKAVTGLKD